MFTNSLGDISIKSKVQSNLFMVSTTTLIPRIYENSLYVVELFESLVKSSGFVKSVTRGGELFEIADARAQSYSGVNVLYSLRELLQIWNVPLSF